MTPAEARLLRDTIVGLALIDEALRRGDEAPEYIGEVQQECRAIEAQERGEQLPTVEAME